VPPILTTNELIWKPNPVPDMVNITDPDAGLFVINVDNKTGPKYERDREIIAAVCNTETPTCGNLATDAHVLMTA